MHAVGLRLVQRGRRWAYIEHAMVGHCLLYCVYINRTQPLSVQCWRSVADGGPTLNRQWLKVTRSDKQATLINVLIIAGPASQGVGQH